MFGAFVGDFFSCFDFFIYLSRYCSCNVIVWC